MEEKQGIKSIEVGARLVRALVEARGPMSLKDLASAACMHPAKAHRYLTSYIATGLIRQDQATKCYLLGEMALQIGIAAINRYDPLARAVDLQQKLREGLDRTTVLSVWGTHGPVTMSVRESSQPVVMSMKLGATLPILNSAAGLVFAAFMPQVIVSRFVDDELEARTSTMPEAGTRQSIERLLDSVRENGFAVNRGHLTYGVEAIAIPFLSHTHEVIAVLSVLGPQHSIETMLEDGTIEVLLSCAREFREWPSKSDH